MKIHIVMISLLAGACVPATSARAARLPQPSFTREGCEEALLSGRSDKLRAEVIKGFKEIHQRVFVPVNFVEPRVRVEDLEVGFAEYQLGPEATEEELAAVRTGARERRRVAMDRHLAGPLSESTPFSDLQARALGIHTPYPERIDQLDVVLTVEDQTVKLTTMHQRQALGEVSFSLADLELGVEGDIQYWAYLKLTDGIEKKPNLGGHLFIADQGVAVMRTEAGPSRFAFAVRVADFEFLEDGSTVQIDVYSVRDCPPEVAGAGQLMVPPKVRANGRGLCFAPTGLKLMTMSPGADSDLADDD